jgi:hypothetical protein
MLRAVSNLKVRCERVRIVPKATEKVLFPVPDLLCCLFFIWNGNWLRAGEVEDLGDVDQMSVENGNVSLVSALMLAVGVTIVILAPEQAKGFFGLSTENAHGIFVLLSWLACIFLFLSTLWSVIIMLCVNELKGTEQDVFLLNIKFRRVLGQSYFVLGGLFVCAEFTLWMYMTTPYPYNVACFIIAAAIMIWTFYEWAIVTQNMYYTKYQMSNLPIRRYSWIDYIMYKPFIPVEVHSGESRLLTAELFGAHTEAS